MFETERLLSDSIKDCRDVVPEAERINLNIISNKKDPKKPTLKNEILEDIIIFLLKEFKCFGENKCFSSDERKEKLLRNTMAKNIEKFMLSGIHQFEAALNYFKRMDNVSVYHDYMYVCPPSKEKKRYYENRYEIPFDFCLIKPILKTIRISLKEIDIAIYPNEEMPDFIVKSLIKEGLESVDISTKCTEECLNLICGITTIKHFDAVFALNVSNLPFIRFKIRRMHFSIEFKDFLQIKQKTILPWVKKLILCGKFRILDITQESIHQFLNNVFEIFPNIKVFKLALMCSDYSWGPVYEKMKEIELSWFKNIPKNVRGNIEFFASVEQLEEEEREYFESIDFDDYIYDIGMAIKEFKIHKKFKFTFLLRD